MLITGLLAALTVAVLFQPSADRFAAAFLFMLPTLAHELIFSDFTGLQYYGSAALFDLAIITMLGGLSDHPRLALRLQAVCLMSIFVNLAGWVSWSLYLSPAVYNSAFVILYAWAVWVFLGKDGANVGGVRVGGGVAELFGHNLTRRSSIHASEGSPWVR